MKQDKSIEKFVKRYDARVRPTGEKYRRLPFIPYTYQVSNDIHDFRDYEVTYEVEDIVRIEMPESNFRHLVELNEMMTAPLPDQFRGLEINNRAVATILYNVKYESRIRNQVPAVKTAWDNYQLLLKLSGQQDPTLDNPFRS